MSTCVYCTSDAHYIYHLNSEIKRTYCSSHVPNFLRKQRDAGLLPTTPEFEAAKAAALGILAPAVVEEAPVEAPAPTPKPKSRKKTSSPAEELVEAQADVPEEVVEEVVAEEVIEEPVVEEAEVVEEALAEDTE